MIRAHGREAEQDEEAKQLRKTLTTEDEVSSDNDTREG
jgi:hypothetical protein